MLEIVSKSMRRPSRFETDNRAKRQMPSAGPRILLLYGSARQGSNSMRLVEEARRVLESRGAETRTFHAAGLPLETHLTGHPKIAELQQLVGWSDGQVWCSPVHHATLSGVMKLLIDGFPCSDVPRASAHGKALSLMQVSGGRMCSGALNDMQRAGQSLGMYITTKNFSVPEAHLAFDDAGRLRDAALAVRLEAAMAELLHLAVLHRDHAPCAVQHAVSAQCSE
jgi:arsenic resistance protein ArsH